MSDGKKKNDPGCEKTDGLWKLVLVSGLILSAFIVLPALGRGCRTYEYSSRLPPYPVVENPGVVATRLAVKGMWTSPVKVKWGEKIDITPEDKDVWLLMRLNGDDALIIERPPLNSAQWSPLPKDVQEIGVSSVEFMISTNPSHPSPRLSTEVKVAIKKA